MLCFLEMIEKTKKLAFLRALPILLVLLVAFSATPAQARYSHIIFDAYTGKVLDEKYQHEQRKPASLTKMMTAYLTFDAINKGKLTWDQQLSVSKRAARQPPSKLGLNPGDTISVRNALLAIITRSANDMAVVLAEGIAGSEAKFASQMTSQAKKLGMTRTAFKNASGLPARGQVTTARDMGVLGQALIRDFPSNYKMFNTEQFVYRGEVINNHNHLLGNYPGLDGIKTGYIRASGFNLVASAERSGRRLVGVVMGGKSANWRDIQMQRLLDNNFEKIGVARAYASYPVPTAMISSRSDSEDMPDRIANEDYTAANEPAGDAADTPAPINPAKQVSALAPVNYPAPVSEPSSISDSSNSWGVQVGAFNSMSKAKTAAAKAQRLHALLKVATVDVAPLAKGKKRVYRARLIGLTENDANTACSTLKKQKRECQIVSPEKLAANF
ncbi:MAG: D-alanyl-D-alanine carboxypeptidase [Alphaproteobacteria bacterium]|nr:MAG: D-alanyl-D-alanine carboxypeptidase [Alphaproteobacteria bacterium]